MAGNAKDLTDATFSAAVLNGVTLVDFWASWCPPCRKQGPVIEKLAHDFAGRASIAKINVDEEAETAGKFQVSNIPTLILFRNGQEMQRFVGLQEEQTLTQAINKLL